MNGTWFDACRGRETSLALRRVTITTRGVCISVFRRISWNSLEQLDPFPPHDPTSLFRNIAIRSSKPSVFSNESIHLRKIRSLSSTSFRKFITFENKDRKGERKGEQERRKRSVCRPGGSFASQWHLSYPANLEHVFPCVGWLHANARRMVIVRYPLSPHPAVFLFAAISLPNRETGLLCTSSLVLHVLATIGFRDSK